MKTFDKELPQAPIIYVAKDVCNETINIGDIVIGATGTGSGYIFKGMVLNIFSQNMLQVQSIWGGRGSKWKVDAKRVRNMKYEKI